MTRVLLNSSCLGYQSLTAQCSLMAAAVTGACITHLSKRLSSTHPLSAESQHHGLATHILTCSQAPSQGLHTHKHRRTHIQTHSHYGDKSCLSWLPSVSHGVVCCTSHLPFTDGCPRALSGTHDCRRVLIQAPHPHPKPADREMCLKYISQALSLRGEGSPARGVRLIIIARLGLIH